MTEREIEIHNVLRIFAITEILDKQCCAALAGRFFSEFVLDQEDWDWFFHQLSTDELSRLKRFLGG